MSEIENGSDTEKSENESLVKEAREFFTLVSDAESESRSLELDDQKFAVGEQWDAEILNDRRLDRRPCLVINRIPQFINQITNDQRQNRPAIKVFPVDDRADIETAKKRQGLIRHIEYNSNAELAYDTAFELAVRSGLGFYRILPKYVDGEGFDQELVIEPIANRFAVYFDPRSKKPDGSDAEKGLIVDEMSEEEFRREYPDSELSKMDDWESIGDSRSGGWVAKETVRVGEFFTKRYESVTLVEMSDGAVGDKSQLPEVLPPNISVVRERTVHKPYIIWAKTNGLEILEKTRIEIPWVPIVPVYGTLLFIEGKKIVQGIVRDAKDPQRMVNYMTSNEAEAIALMPRSPYLGASGVFEGHEDKWQTANRKNHAFLEYNSIDANGNPAQAPSRQILEPAVQAITQAKMIAGDDMKSVIGIYDASLGARSNENSGVAIQRRNAQAQTSNFHFTDNLSRSMRHTGRILDAWIPYIYDAERVVRIIGDEGDQEVIAINKAGPNGEPPEWDMTAGKYDIVVETGPSFATKRQEAAENMMGMVKANPTLMQVIGDLIWKSFDFPGAQEAAERIKKTIPPNLIDDKNKQPIPPEVQAQMQQMSQMIEQLTAQANESAKVIEMKLVELESKERIEMRKLEVQAEIELAKLGSKSSQILLEAEIAELNARGQQLGSLEPIPTDFNSAGPEQAMAPEQQQPTGGLPPGQPMEQMP